MSKNLRKAQKHMQRASELLNQNQFGFGVNREKKARNEDTEIAVDELSDFVKKGEYSKLQEFIDARHNTFFKGRALDKINKLDFEKYSTLRYAKTKMTEAIEVNLHIDRNFIASRLDRDHEKLEQRLNHTYYFYKDLQNLKKMITDNNFSLDEFETALIEYHGCMMLYVMIDASLRSKLRKIQGEDERKTEIDKMIAARGVSEHVANRFKKELEDKQAETQSPQKKPRIGV